MPRPPHLAYLDEAAKAAESKLPDNHGFILLTFPFNNPQSRCSYTSSADREAAIKVMKAMLFHWGESENWMRHIK